MTRVRVDEAQRPVDLSGAAGRETGDPSEHRLLEVRLVPHRSLTHANFKVLMAVVALAGTASSLPFILVGAWPVAGFLGLDVLLLYAAFRANFRAARAYEDVVVTPMELRLAKVSAKGVRREFHFHPAWVRLNREEHEEFGVQRLSLRSRGRSVEVAGFLGPDAKAEFASGLSQALNEARRGPRFS